MIYTVTLNPAVDLIVRLHQDCKFGTMNRAYKEIPAAGGKGINVSRILNELGTKSTAVGFIGGFSGQFIESELYKEGIASDFVQIDNTTRLNIKLLIDGQNSTEINAPSPIITKVDIMHLARKFAKVKPQDVIIISGTLPKDLSINLFEDFLKILNSKKAHIVIDMARKPLLRALKYHPFLIKPNKSELEESLYVNTNNDEDVIKGAKQLLKLGARNVVVSLGERGAIFVNDEQIIKVDAPKGKVENAVGSGDSLVAAFVDEFIKTNNFEKALKKGVYVGSATAFSVDLAKRPKIKELLKQAKIKF